MAHQVAYKSQNPERSARASIRSLRTSFKKMAETAAVIRKMPLKKAISFLKDVKEKKQAVPFRRFNGGVGRCAQAKQWSTTQARWPQKSAEFMLQLLRNAEASAKVKNLNVDSMIIESIQVQRAQVKYRRCYRAHGRVNAHNSHPAHVEVVICEPNSLVERSSKAISE